MADHVGGPPESKFVKFTPYKVNVRPVEFGGTPPSLAVFPEWVWYTPAPAFLWGGLGHAILSELQHELGFEYYQATFRVSLFSGFDVQGDAFWNNTLWACKQTEWEPFKEALLGVMNVDMENGLIVKYGLQELSVYDPVAVQNNSVITPDTPTLDVVAFGVMSNKSTIAFDVTSGAVERPHVYTVTPDPAFVEMADMLLSGQQELGGVVDNFKNVKIDGSKYPGQN
jgi:hypothetical protein|tara:strand:+ start:1492 stop:2169 length:678 start_codon:yes stop_codon:yes gene_type:complete